MSLRGVLQGASMVGDGRWANIASWLAQQQPLPAVLPVIYTGQRIQSMFVWHNTIAAQLEANTWPTM